MRNLYGIHDRVANSIIGGLVIERNDGVILRMFDHLLRDKNTAVGLHPADHDLVKLGSITDDGTITAIRPEIVATGAAIAASHYLDDQSQIVATNFNPEK